MAEYSRLGIQSVKVFESEKIVLSCTSSNKIPKAFSGDWVMDRFMDDVLIFFDVLMC